MKPLGRNQRLILEAIADGRPPGGNKKWTKEKVDTALLSLANRGLITKEDGSPYVVTEEGDILLHPRMPLAVSSGPPAEDESSSENKIAGQWGSNSVGSSADRAAGPDGEPTKVCGLSQ